jgi:WD40 repeat protein
MSADSATLVIIGNDGDARLWDLTGEPAAEPALTLPDVGDLMGISADHRRLVSIVKGPTLAVWDLAAPDPAASRREAPYQAGNVVAFALSADGSTAAAAAEKDTAVAVWDLSGPAGQAPLQLASAVGEIAHLAISADGRVIAGRTSDGKTQVWDRDTTGAVGAPHVLPGLYERSGALAISADGRTLALLSILPKSNDNEPVVELWQLGELGTGDEIILRDTSSHAQIIDLSADGRWLAAGGDAGVQLWDLTAKPEPTSRSLSAGDLSVSQVGLSADGRTLVAGNSNGEIRVWDMSSAAPARSMIKLTNNTSAFSALTLSADGRTLVTDTKSGTQLLWSLKIANLERRACLATGRNLTISEWQQFFGEAPYERTCGGLPVHSSLLIRSLNLVKGGDLDAARALLRRAQEIDPTVDLNPNTAEAEHDVEALIRQLAPAP